MRQSRTVVEVVLSKGGPVYGLTTGVGERKAFPLDPRSGSGSTTGWC
jgi:histidine ammonia-lyase